MGTPRADSPQPLLWPLLTLSPATSPLASPMSLVLPFALADSCAWAILPQILPLLGPCYSGPSASHRLCRRSPLPATAKGPLPRHTHTKTPAGTSPPLSSAQSPSSLTLPADHLHGTPAPRHRNRVWQAARGRALTNPEPPASSSGSVRHSPSCSHTALAQGGWERQAPPVERAPICVPTW